MTPRHPNRVYRVSRFRLHLSRFISAISVYLPTVRKYNGLVHIFTVFPALLIMPNSLYAEVDPATATLERSAIDDKYKWDLSKMYATQQDWEAHYKKVDSMIGEFAAKAGKVGDSAGKSGVASLA